MRMGRGCCGGQRDRFRALNATHDVIRQPRPLTLPDRGAAAQIGQLKIRRAVAAVGGAEQREQRRVLADRQHLTGAKGPSSWGKVAREQRDLAEKGICHLFRSCLDAAVSSVLRRKNSKERDDVVDRQVRLRFSCPPLPPGAGETVLPTSWAAVPAV